MSKCLIFLSLICLSACAPDINDVRCFSASNQTGCAVIDENDLEELKNQFFEVFE